jgi:hypothetical protein
LAKKSFWLSTNNAIFVLKGLVHGGDEKTSATQTVTLPLMKPVTVAAADYTTG